MDVVERYCPCKHRPQGEKLFHPLSPALGNVDMHTHGMWVSRTQRLIPIQGRPLIKDTHNVCVCVCAVLRVDGKHLQRLAPDLSNAAMQFVHFYYFFSLSLKEFRQV